MASRSATIETVELRPSPIERYQPLLDDGAWKTFEASMGNFAAKMRGRVVWNVNSTARGGGVAELLKSLIPHDVASGVDERWVVIEGSPEFFEATKKLHILLHGVAPDGTVLTAADRRLYEETLAANAASLTALMQPGDVALLHDPQTAGLIPALARHGTNVVWRSHIGADEPNAVVRSAVCTNCGSLSAVGFARSV